MAGQRKAFTLIELLVAISIIALLIGILLPALAAARRAARQMQCLSHVRNLTTAHWMFMPDNDDRFIEVGLPHGSSSYDEELAWVNTLEEYYGSTLIIRSPLDTSPHWPGGTQLNGRWRLTSYGVNDMLTTEGPEARRATRLSQVPNPSATVHFLIMSYTGSFATSDHVHANQWGATPGTPASAAEYAAGQSQIDAHGGPPLSPQSRSSYGYLDGHARTQRFREVYQTRDLNRFQPAIAR